MMKQRRKTLFCAWCVCLICVCAGGDGARPRQSILLSSEDVLHQVFSHVTRPSTSRDIDEALQQNQSVTGDATVSPNSILRIQATHETTSNYDVLENVRQTDAFLVQRTTEALLPPPPSRVVPLQGVIGVTGHKRNQGIDETVHHHNSEPYDVQVVSLSSVVSGPATHRNKLSKNAVSDERQGVTGSSPQDWRHSTEASPYTTTAHANVIESKIQQDAGGATQQDTRGFCGSGADLTFLEEEYSMLSDTHKITGIQHHTAVTVNITGIDEATRFLIIQAHSQNHYIILSNQTLPQDNCYTNSTDPGLVLWPTGGLGCSRKACQVFIINCHNKNITVLFMVQNYTSLDPIPGGFFPAKTELTPGGDKLLGVPMPFLSLDPNVLTTEVSFRAAAMLIWGLAEVAGALRYEIYLTYMYERDLSEEKYWDTLIATSTHQGLKANGKLVDVRENNETAEYLNAWLVSYSGVGAVVTVVVSYNGSNGALYSSAVSYGCDFIEAEEYRCTKLVTSLAKLFCASLLFIGGILLFLGHRWLNFTMFISGFLFSWCMLFLMFAQDTSSPISALGWGTLVGAVLGGALWLLGWHKFQRPFHSSLIIIIMAVFFVGMIVTYFLRFAISPKTSNLPAFVVFPVLFTIIIIAYSIFDIKKVHIFSCTLLGSYSFIVPFAFYFGSSLTYIVINVLGLVTVQHYPETVGYPPFQVCDVILLCFWVILFVGGMAYQLYRERASPPFHPPNLTSWKDFKKSANFVFDKMFACLPMDPDPGGMDIEDRPAWLLRVVYTSNLAWRKLTCKGGDTPESGYESFPRIRRLSQYNDEDSNTSESRMAVILARIREWKGKVEYYFRKGDERLLQESDDEEQQREEQEEDESQLLEGNESTVTCCAFRNTQVVLDDAYTTSA